MSKKAIPDAVLGAFVLATMTFSLGCMIWDCARNGELGWFVLAFVESLFLGGILLWMGVKWFNKRQKKRRLQV